MEKDVRNNELPWHTYKVPMQPCLWWSIMGKEIFDSSQRQCSPLCKFRFSHGHSRMTADLMLCPRTQCIFLWNAQKLIAGLTHLSSIQGCKQALKKKMKILTKKKKIFKNYNRIKSKSLRKSWEFSFTCTILKHLLKVFNILFVSELVRLLSKIQRK